MTRNNIVKELVITKSLNDEIAVFYLTTIRVWNLKFYKELRILNYYIILCKLNAKFFFFYKYTHKIAILCS